MTGKYHRKGRNINKGSVMKKTLIKMAAVPQIHTLETTEASTSDRQVLSPLLAASLPQASCSDTSPILYSTALKEGVIPSNVGHIIPAEIPSQNPVNVHTNAEQARDVSFNVTDLFNRISEMLDRGLAQNAERITRDIRADFQCLGNRIETIEHKLDINIARIDQNADHLLFLQEQLEAAQARIENLENRSRRDNFRVRGLPESIVDVHAAI